MANSYRLSNGEYIKKSVIDARIRVAKQKVIDAQIEEHGYNFCEDYDKSQNVILDCAHYESVDSCQKNGRSEKAYDVENIRMLCRGCHAKYDGLDLKFKGDE